jgi:hypothetical protein
MHFLFDRWQMNIQRATKNDNRRLKRPFGFTILSLAIALLAGMVAQDPSAEAKTWAAGRHENYVQPLAFEPNQGQFEPAVRYLARGRGFDLYIGDRELGIAVPQPAQVASSASSPPEKYLSQVGKMKVLRITLAGAEVTSQDVGIRQLPGRVNYFLGNDSSRWHAGIPIFAGIMQHRSWRGIDLFWYGNSSQLECDFIVQPFADPNQIDLALEGGKASLDKQGDLQIVVGERTLTLRKPIIFQKSASRRRPVPGGYVLTRSAGVDHVRLKLGGYDSRRRLIIDPIVALQYSTYLGGSGPSSWIAGETGYGIAVDASGATYVTGTTWSSDFPVTAGVVQPQATAGGDRSENFNAFISKFAPGGGALVYSTYLGGAPGTDNVGAQGYGIAVDALGDAYVVGTTISQNFPLVNAFQSTAPEAFNAFISKLNPTGSRLLYSTYLTSTRPGPVYAGSDGRAITVDSSGNAYVTGSTWGTNLPTTQGAIQTTLKGKQNAYVAKLSAAGNTLVFLTYLGGSNLDRANAIALDNSNGVYVTGQTASADFPVTAGCYQSILRAASNAFITHLSSTGALVYSTYLGGTGDGTARGESGYGIAVDATGEAFIAGQTFSKDFPVVRPLQSSTASSNGTGFVSKLNSAGTALLYSTYLGGDGSATFALGDSANAIAVDSSSNIYVAGVTRSTNFPTANALQTSLENPYGDAFVAKLGPGGKTLLYSTYLGGSGNPQQPVSDGDFAAAITLDSANNAYVTGATESPDFPIAAAYQGSLTGTRNAFVAELRVHRGLTP